MDIWRYEVSSSIWEGIIDIVAPIALTFVAAKRIFNNDLSIGSMIMFLSLFKSFLNPLDSLVSLGMRFPMGIRNYKLIKFILNIDDEQLNIKAFNSKEIKTITLKDIDFNYDRNIFKIKNFNIYQNLKLKGKNGSGKSSFLKMLSTRYKVNGQIFVNDIELSFINLDNLRSRIYYTELNDYFPDVSLFEYITLMDKQKANILNNNISKYNLMPLLTNMKLDFSKHLSNNGSNFSSGQLQVIKLLRLFTMQYDLILLDEGTDNIDEDNLKYLAKAIRLYQKGIFVEVSHNDKYISEGKVIDFEKIIVD